MVIPCYYSVIIVVLIIVMKRGVNYLKLLRELCIILIISFIGNVINKVLKLSIPGNVIGIFILLAILCLGVIKVEDIEHVSSFLLKNLAFFFVPAAVQLMTCFKTISKVVFPILAVLVISSIIVIVVTALTVRIIKKRQDIKTSKSIQKGPREENETINNNSTV